MAASIGAHSIGFLGPVHSLVQLLGCHITYSSSYRRSDFELSLYAPTPT
jgi:hypothetical protein